MLQRTLRQHNPVTVDLENNFRDSKEPTKIYHIIQVLMPISLQDFAYNKNLLFYVTSMERFSYFRTPYAFRRMRAHLDKTSGYTKDSRSMVFGKQEFVWVKGINNNFQFYIPGQIGG